MISPKIKSLNDWIAEGQTKNTKYKKKTTNTSMTLTNTLAKSMGIFNDTKTLKGYKELYDTYKNLGSLGVLEMLDTIWSMVTNDEQTIKILENHLLAVTVYFDFPDDFMNQYSMWFSQYHWWFNDTNVKRPYRNKEIAAMKYNHIRLKIESILDK